MAPKTFAGGVNTLREVEESLMENGWKEGTDYTYDQKNEQIHTTDAAVLAHVQSWLQDLRSTLYGRKKQSLS